MVNIKISISVRATIGRVVAFTLDNLPLSCKARIKPLYQKTINRINRFRLCLIKLNILSQKNQWDLKLSLFELHQFNPIEQKWQQNMLFFKIKLKKIKESCISVMSLVSLPNLPSCFSLWVWWSNTVLVCHLTVNVQILMVCPTYPPENQPINVWVVLFALVACLHVW